MKWGVTTKVFCTPQSFTDFLMVRCLKLLLNLRTLPIFLSQKAKCSKLSDLFCDDKEQSIADIFEKKKHARCIPST